MKERPLTLRPRQLNALLSSGRTTFRFRRPLDGMYRELAVGDLLWLREQFFLPSRFNSRAPSQCEGPGVAPSFEADLDGREPADLGLGLSRASFTLPRIWSRLHFHVDAVAQQPLQELTEAEARQDGFRSREAWLEDWDSFVSSVNGRMRTRLAAANPTVLLVDSTLVRAPIDGTRKEVAA